MSGGICDARYCKTPSVISFAWDGVAGHFELCDKHHAQVCESPKQTKDAVLELCGRQKKGGEERLEAIAFQKQQEDETMAASDRAENGGLRKWML